MKRRIMWHKWQDPLATYVKHYKDDEEERQDAEEQASRDSFAADDELVYGDKAPEKGKGLGPGIIGPMGFIPMYEENTPGKLYNFWMGHTTFDLDEAMVEAIEKVPGVEILDVFTRYRFRLGIAKCFDGRRVRVAIDNAVKQKKAKPKANEAKADPLATAKHLLSQKYPYWAIFVMPDNRLQMCGGSTAEEVEAKGRKFAAEAKEVVQSWPTNK